MSITKKFTSGKTVYSLEVFPPKKSSSIDTIYSTLTELKPLNPDFISVTYGAGGNEADLITCEIASTIQNEYDIEPMAHLTCVNNTKKDVKIILDLLKTKGVHNIMALRGDRSPTMQPKTDFKYASDLISFIKEQGDFHISAACYPEGHVEAETLEKDIVHLKTKVDIGAEHLVSQLFFDNTYFYTFLEKARAKNINVPIEAGIMPVVNKKQIERMVALCGASLPQKFVKMINRYEANPEALREAGIAYATDQIIDLVINGVQGVHLYTMNNSYIAKKITENIAPIIYAT